MDLEFAEVCPLCGGNGSYYGEGGSRGEIVKTDKCVECGVIYQNPRMTREALDEYYSIGNYHATHGTALVTEINRTKYFFEVLNGMEILPYRVLDIGCGRGYLIRAIHLKYGSEVVGIEKRILPGALYDNLLTSKDDVEGKFDLILCIQTLEHLYDPQEELLWMASKLEPGGTILFDLPMDDKIYLPHVFVFNRLSSKTMLNRLGFKFLHLDFNKEAIFLIGDHYDKMKSDKIIGNIEASMSREGIYH